MDLNNVKIEFTEDEVVDMLLNEDSNFGGKGRAKKQAKRELKDKLRKEHGKDWWKPKQYIKMKKDFRLNKNKVQNEALAKLKADKKDAKLEAKKDKWNAKKEIGVENPMSAVMASIGSVVGGKKNDSISTALPANTDDKKKKTLIFAGGALVVGVGIFILTKK